MSISPNTMQLKDLGGRNKQLLRLVELSVTLNSTLDLDELLKLITATATELLECESASILLFDEKNQRLYFAAATGSDPAQLAEIPVPIDNSLAGTIFRTNQPLMLNNAEEDPRHFSPVSDHIKFKIKTLLGVPMPIKDRVVGVLEAVNKHNEAFTESDAAILSVTAAHAAIAINNAQLLHSTRQALEKVTATNEIKNNFLSLASHELRTPLGIVIGYATFLQAEAKGQMSSDANMVLSAAIQMRSLLDQMSNLTVLQAKELSIRLARTSLQDVLNASIEAIKYSAAQRNMQLSLDFPETPIFVNIDEENTTLAIVNLLTNAIRFSAEGSEITLGAARQDGHVTVWVQDHGIGIPADKLQKIFEEFYQVQPPNTRHYGGLGIGLTIAKGLIEAQGGKLWAESEGKEKGSTFKVILQVAEE
jgi:signal transduction histidine kinase